MDLNRRGFFKLLGGGIACAILPSIVLAKEVIQVPVEFGWTWFIKPTDLPLELAKTIPNIMASNTQKIYDSTARDKHLLLDLKELPHSQVKLNLSYISEDEQNKRMIQRMADRKNKREKDKLYYKNKFEQQDKIIEDTEANNKHLYKETRIKYWENRVASLERNIEKDAKLANPNIDAYTYWDKALRHANKELNLARSA